jgi:hypothetical protein
MYTQVHLKRNIHECKRCSDKLRVSKTEHNTEHKEDITKQITKGDIVQNIKERVN